MSIENIQILLAAKYQKQPSKFYEYPKFYDLEFLPSDLSVYNHVMIERPLDIAIHWRRPDEIFKNLNIRNDPNTLIHANPSRVQSDLAKIDIVQQNSTHIFYDSIDPQDIFQGCKNSILNNEYFLSAVSILSQRPPLIERLFDTKIWNREGIYRLKICKGGEWIQVTIDDLFPCEPFGEPLFANCANNEIWVMLLEKAYAKVHGSYYLLKGG